MPLIISLVIIFRLTFVNLSISVLNETQLYLSTLDFKAMLIFPQKVNDHLRSAVNLSGHCYPQQFILVNFNPKYLISIQSRRFINAHRRDNLISCVFGAMDKGIYYPYI